MTTVRTRLPGWQMMFASKRSGETWALGGMEEVAHWQDALAGGGYRYQSAPAFQIQHVGVCL